MMPLAIVKSVKRFTPTRVRERTGNSSKRGSYRQRITTNI